MHKRSSALSRHARRGSYVLATLITAASLAACGPGEEEETEGFRVDTGTAPAEVVTTAVAPSPTPTPSPTPELPESPLVRELEMECGGEEYSDRAPYSTLEEVWALEPEAHTSCDVDDDTTVLLDVEREALAHAYGTGSDSLHILYGICGEAMMGNAGKFGPLPYSEGQRAEAEGALILCPDHPDAEPVRELMGEAAADDEMRADGRMFAGGTYLVGEEVQPGSYVSESGDSEPFDGCYWELTAESGDIIDNYFSTSALRVELTVTSSAYSLTVDGCGEFRPVE